MCPAFKTGGSKGDPLSREKKPPDISSSLIQILLFPWQVLLFHTIQKPMKWSRPVTIYSYHSCHIPFIHWPRAEKDWYNQPTIQTWVEPDTFTSYHGRQSHFLLPKQLLSLSVTVDFQKQPLPPLFTVNIVAHTTGKFLHGVPQSTLSAFDV